jgi:succinate dehydrogenase / fumarate reductase cytochrome b subunit
MVCKFDAAGQKLHGHRGLTFVSKRFYISALNVATGKSQRYASRPRRSPLRDCHYGSDLPLLVWRLPIFLQWRRTFEVPRRSILPKGRLVVQSDCPLSFGRHEFVIRRLHSLTGLVPIGGYLAFHLLTNGSILDGPEAFQHRVDQIHRLGPTTLFLLEWPFIFLPILFHGVIGMLIVLQGQRNLADYPYLGNIRYTLQRVTGVIAFAFILYHVFHMHGWLRLDWWEQHVARPLGGARFQPDDALSAARAIQASIWVQVVYAIGVLACVYHLANGVWTMGITWGVWTGPNAQRWANVPAAALGCFLTVVGMGALFGMCTVDAARPPQRAELPGHSAPLGAPPSEPAVEPVQWLAAGVASAPRSDGPARALSPRSEASVRSLR